MVALDVILVAILLFGLIRGIMKGFILELSGLIGIIVSIYLAKNYAENVGEFLDYLFHFETLSSPLVAFVITFLLSLLIVHFIALLINKLVKLVLLNWLNRLLGGVFSFLKYLLILSVFINAFDMMNSSLDLLSREKIEESKLYIPIQKVAVSILPALHLNDLVVSIKNN